MRKQVIHSACVHCIVSLNNRYAFYCINLHVHLTRINRKRIDSIEKLSETAERERKEKSMFLKCLHCFPTSKSEKLLQLSISFNFSSASCLYSFSSFWMCFALILHLSIEEFANWKHRNSNLQIPIRITMHRARCSQSLCRKSHSLTYIHPTIERT